MTVWSTKWQSTSPTVPASLELFATSSVRTPRLKIDACTFTDAKQRNIDGTRAFVGLAEIVLVQ